MTRAASLLFSLVAYAIFFATFLYLIVFVGDIPIAGQTFVLPLKASTVSRMGKVMFKNDTEFRMYNRFGTESTITFAPDPLSEDQVPPETPTNTPPK